MSWTMINISLFIIDKRLYKKSIKSEFRYFKEPQWIVAHKWHMTHETWRMTHDAWHMTHGTWRMAHGAWRMAHDEWHMAHDTWHMAHDTWHMARDLWHMTHDTSHMLIMHFSFLMSTSSTHCFSNGSLWKHQVFKRGSMCKEVHQCNMWLYEPHKWRVLWNLWCFLHWMVIIQQLLKYLWQVCFQNTYKELYRLIEHCSIWLCWRSLSAECKFSFNSFMLLNFHAISLVTIILLVFI